MPYSFQSTYFDLPIETGRVLDIFLPARIQRQSALFFVHGGGWRGGSRTDYHTIMRAFNEKGFICASTDYRLAKGSVLNQITDIRHGYDAFISFLKSHHHPVRVIVHGASAGAHLAALLTLAKPGACGEPLDHKNYHYQNEWIAPVGAALQATPVTFEPWEDIFPHIWTAMEDIVGMPYAIHPELYQNVSPIRYVAHDSPPVFFMEAGNEHMFPLKYVLEFIEKIKAAGRSATYKVYQNAEHGFFYDITRRAQAEAFSDFSAFIESLD